MSNSFKTLLIWLGLGLILIMSFNALEQKKDEHRTQVEYSEFIKSAKGGKIESVELEAKASCKVMSLKGHTKTLIKVRF